MYFIPCYRLRKFYFKYGISTCIKCIDFRLHCGGAVLAEGELPDSGCVYRHPM